MIVKLALVAPAAMEMDAGARAIPFCVPRVTTSGVVGAVSSEIVAVPVRPAITPAAGQTETCRLRRKVVSAKA